VPGATATARLIFKDIVAPLSARSCPRTTKRYLAFFVVEGCPLIWIKAAMMSLGQNSIWQPSRAPCHGRHVDSPLSRSEDNRQSLSSRTQCRAGHDHRSLDAVRSSSPGGPLAGLAERRDDDPNFGRLYLALFAFEVRADLHESRIFYMDHIMIPDLPGRATIWASTIGAAERLAEMNRCGAVRAEFGAGSEPSDRDFLTSLESMGYSLAGIRAFKRLEAKSDRTGDGSDRVRRPPRGLYDA